MNRKNLLKTLALVACLMCSLGAAAAEAYVCYTPENTTLTFYYDDYRSSRTGTTFDIGGYPDWVIGTSRVNDYVTTAVFDALFADARPNSTEMWFSDMINLTTITGIEYLNTSRVTSMMNMFSNCSALTSIDVSGFNTSRVTNMAGMFTGCSRLTTLDLSSFNTAQVDYMLQMFRNCSNLRTIYVGDKWDATDLINSFEMFDGCTSLVGGQGTAYDANHVDAEYAHIDGGLSDPGYLTNINGPTEPEAYACYTPENTTLTFYYDEYRSSRTGTTYDLNEGNNHPGWRDDGTCVSVTQVVFDPAFADVRPTSASNWFSDMINLEDISGLDYLNTSEVTDMSYMFSNCCKLTGGSDFLSTLETENVTSMAYMFFNCCDLEDINLRNFNTQRVTNMSSVFKFCSKLTTLDVSSFDTYFVQQMQYMFHGCSRLTTIYCGNAWSSGSIINSANMFLGCTNLVGGRGTTYDANHLDIQYAHVDFGTVNPGYFTDINAPTEPEAYAVLSPDNTMLTFYYDLDRIIRPGTSFYLNEGYDDPGWSFDGSYESITQVVFDPSFADARPTSTCSWFWGMRNLQSIIGMEYLNTSEVTTMWGMFASCMSLTSIDASCFDTGKVTNALVMFNGCTNLTTIYGGDGWNTNSMSVSNNMFSDCVNLVGGMGTTYDANHVDKAYAHIDGGPSNPGYFTAKFTRGDVNGDGNVNITDVTVLINYLLSHNATGVNVAAADCNQDSNVNISDVTKLINYLLSHNW